MSLRAGWSAEKHLDHVEAELSRLRSTRAEWLREIVADIEQRYPGVREPDNRSDWGKGVAWVLDRLINIATDYDRESGQL